MLIFGAGLSVGWGVTTHDLALPGFLARTLATETERGIDVDLVSHPDTHSGDALGRLKALRLWRYDAIVIVLGVNESISLVSSKVWERDLETMLAELPGSIAVPVAVTGVQGIRSIPVYNSPLGSIANAHATALNRVTARICARMDNASFVPLPNFALPSRGRHRTPDIFAESARLIAASLAPALAVPRHQINDPYPAAGYDTELAERERQAAVDALDLAHPELARALDRLLEIARLTLNVSTAMVSVLDRDRQLIRTIGWIDAPTELPRVGSLCEATIRQWGGMALPDTLQDERFRASPFVIGAPHLRFYAGYPLESRSGERVGAFCIFDTAPRNAADIDLVGLREIAVKVQRQLQLFR